MIGKASEVASTMPFTAPVPLEFKCGTASDIITLDRLNLVERMRELCVEAVNRGEVATVLGVAEALEREIRQAGRE
jgi:hypothetical protein